LALTQTEGLQLVYIPLYLCPTQRAAVEVEFAVSLVEGK